MVELSLFLGTFSATERSDKRVIHVKTKADFASAKQECSAASLERLELTVKASEIAECFDPMEISGWVSFLKPEAAVSVHVVELNGDNNLQLIHTSFLLAGLSGASERRETDGSVTLVAFRKPQKAVISAPIKLQKRVVLEDDLDDDGDLIDEDALLNNDLLNAPPSITERTATDDCSGRKPCDDCTCGRAEREAGSSPDNQPKQVATSSCGNCGKGDAFRCASCPYLGKPAFKAGEEHLVLDLTDDL